MGILKRAADLTYTFRFIRMMVMDWKSWDAYKLGIIDENGKRQRDVKLDDDQKKLLGFYSCPPKDEFTRIKRRSDEYEIPEFYSLPKIN